MASMDASGNASEAESGRNAGRAARRVRIGEASITPKADHLTIAEYVERFAPDVAELFPLDEWTAITPALLGFLDTTERRFGFAPTHRPGKVRVFHLFALAHAGERLWSHLDGTRLLEDGPEIADGSAARWFNGADAAPVTLRTAEQRAAVEPEVAWQFCREFIVGC